MRPFRWLVMLICFLGFSLFSFPQAVPNDAITDSNVQQFKQSFVLNKDIPIGISIGTTCEGTPLSLIWIRFSKGGGHVRAAIRAIETTILNAKWRINVQLLDSQHNNLANIAEVCETRRLFRGVASYDEKDLIFDLGGENILQDTSWFLLRIERAPDAATATLHSIDPYRAVMVDRAQDYGFKTASPGEDCSYVTMKVQLHRPWPFWFRRVRVQVWRAYDQDDPALPRFATVNVKNQYWQEPARKKIWFPVIAHPYSGGSWWKRLHQNFIYHLSPGEYRVSLHGINSTDTAPLGISSPLHLSKGGMNGKLDVTFKKGSSRKFRANLSLHQEKLLSNMRA